VTPDQLVADQAAVDAANAAVAAAQQNVDQATIVSPITGTVAAVTLQPGEHVSAAAPTASIVVIGPGGYEVATTIGVGDVPMVHLGDSAVVVPDGDGRSLDGKVVAIGASPSTTGTTPTYPVVVGLVGDDGPLGNGASATVTITEAHASDALTVPTSAVHAVGAGALHVVTVLTASGETKTTPVLTGAVGTASTEILSGLSAGDKVVLADLSQAVPTANSSTTPRGLGGLGLGGTGGGLGGGGFGGGRAVAGR
jgi:multidrug efflux pump subunit AcrA (membrane-fusion protein)